VSTLKHRKQENRLEYLGSSRLLKPCVYKGLFGTGMNRRVVEVASTTYVDIIKEI